jgi:hypothetical protein
MIVGKHVKEPGTASDDGTACVLGCNWYASLAAEPECHGMHMTSSL